MNNRYNNWKALLKITHYCSMYVCITSIVRRIPAKTPLRSVHHFIIRTRHAVSKRTTNQRRTRRRDQSNPIGRQPRVFYYRLFHRRGDVLKDHACDVPCYRILRNRPAQAHFLFTNSGRPRQSRACAAADVDGTERDGKRGSCRVPDRNRRRRLQTNT